MGELERLHEIVIDLERAREQERESRLEAEALLEGLRVLILSESTEAMFDGLVAVFRPVLSFQDAFALTAQEDGTMRTATATSPLFADLVWRPQALFERVLKGQPTALFDVSQVAEWREQPESVRAAVGSALYIPLCGGQRSAMLVCVHPERGFFGQKQVKLVRRFAPLASQVLLNVDLQAAMARRGHLLQAAAGVSRVAGSILDEEELIQEAVNLIRDRFDLYYVGLFLLDDQGRWAILRAGTGQAGQAMLQAGHRLAVGGESMIGRCVATGRACRALDTGAEAVRFDNPLLPLTRSEIALPLFSRGRVIGAMTIQSAQPAAFSDEDVAVLQTMADQLANAIENARLFERTQGLLAQTRSLYQVGQLITAAGSIEEVMAAVLEYARRLDPDRCVIALLDDPDAAPAERQVEVKGVWDRGGREAAFLGNRFTPVQIPVMGTLGPADRLVVEDFATSEGVDERTRATFQHLGVGAAVIVPLAVGGRLLGWLLVEAVGRSCVFAGQEVEALQAIAGQAAVALQNLRRMEEVQARAERERVARAALAVRVGELSCLSDIGRKIDEAPAVEEFLVWVAGRVPAAMQYPGLCRVAIEFEGRLYGAAEATRLPRQMVQQMRIGGKAVGRVCVAYTEDHDFLDEESALLGDITRRVSGYIENRRLIQEAQARAAQERRLRTITDRIRQGASTEAILRVGLEELSQVLGASQCIVRLGPRDQLLAGQPAPWSEVQPSAGAERRSDGRRRQGEKGGRPSLTDSED